MSGSIQQQSGVARRVVGVIALVMIVIVAVTGCAENMLVQRRTAYLARRDLVGLSRGELISCAGQPAGSHMEGSREYLTYVGELPEKENAKDSEVCVATFLLRDDRVYRLDYTSISGRLVSKMEHCYDMVEPCLSLM